MLRAVIYYIVTVIRTMELVIATDQCTKYQFKSPFYPGVSYEDIHNKNPESHAWSGCYWITDGPSRVYWGMTYTVLYHVRTFTIIFQKLMISQDIIVLTATSGCIVTWQLLLLVTWSLHALVWEEDGEKLLILISVQEMIVRVSGGKPQNLVLASVEWPMMIHSHVLLPVSLIME